MKELFEKKQTWTPEEIANVEYSLLKGLLGCRSVEAVEAATTYGKYLNSIGIPSTLSQKFCLIYWQTER